MTLRFALFVADACRGNQSRNNVLRIVCNGSSLFQPKVNVAVLINRRSAKMCAAEVDGDDEMIIGSVSAGH